MIGHSGSSAERKRKKHEQGLAANKQVRCTPYGAVWPLLASLRNAPCLECYRIVTTASVQFAMFLRQPSVDLSPPFCPCCCCCCCCCCCYTMLDQPGQEEAVH